MKKVVLFLMFCFGVMACAVEQGETELSTDESAVTVDKGEIAKAVAAAPAELSADLMKMFKVDDGVETQACTFLGSAPCNGTWNCAFECCSGAVRTVQEPCGSCTARANSWCGSGVRQIWWY
jgi:hypothetical protein